MKTTELKSFSLEKEIYGTLLESSNGAMTSMDEIEQKIISDVVDYVRNTKADEKRISEFNYLIQFHITDSDILYLESDVSYEYENEDDKCNFVEDFIKDLQSFITENKITEIESKVSYFVKFSMESVTIEYNTPSYYKD